MMMDAAAVETADLKATIPAETTKLLANGKEYTIHRPTSSEWIEWKRPGWTEKASLLECSLGLQIAGSVNRVPGTAGTRPSSSP